MIGRAAVVLVAAALLVVEVVKNAVAAGAAAGNPESAVKVWSANPAVQNSHAMASIAQAERYHREVPPAVFSSMRRAAVREPLAPEPFLVRGLQAELAGDGLAAERAFEAAQWRDPRSLPAAYFLADRYLRAGDLSRGLTQVAALARLAPRGSKNVAPYLAIYARRRANWRALRTMFRDHPELAGPTLAELADSASSAPAVLALADPRQSGADAPWLAPLLNSLTVAGQYGQARAIWARATGARAGLTIYDTEFADKKAPPPFNWALTSSAVGVAERQSGGRLHIVFYGHDDGILATQLLLLKPGAYRLSLQLLGQAARGRALAWSIWCDKAAEPIASVTLDAAAARGWHFKVPSGCPAQWLRLSGAAGELAQKVDVTIAALTLERAGG